jgi:hypothetical protein
MDTADVPERKAFPPRGLIISLSVIVSFVFASLWIVGSARWREVDRDDPRKQLAFSMFEEVRPALRWIQRRSSRVWPWKKNSSTPPVNFGDPMS